VAELRQRRRFALHSFHGMTQTSLPQRSWVGPRGLSAASVGVLTVAAAVATSTSYVLQPELPAVAGDIGTSLSVVGVLAGLPIAGYLLGLALLVPLADRLRSNRLLAAQLILLGGGLLVAAAAPGPVLLGLGLFVSGLCASTGAQMSSLVGRYTEPARRGRAVGTVTAGISAGIVLGRIFGGALADWAGWRVMLVVVAVACALLGRTALVTLPHHRLYPSRGYLAVVTSLPRLVWTNRALRLAAASGTLWFLAFSLIWVGLSLALAQPPISLSPGTIGLYSLAGLLGVFATRVAGRMADRCGSPIVILSGLLLAGTCTVVMAFSLTVTPVLLVALALFDAGLFAAQVANQSRVLSLDPAHPAQFNSAYMVVYFVGGTTGTAVGGLLITVVGWTGAALVATLAIIVAIAIVLRAMGWRSPA
jgi:predicted MFS family arabinose efflux permease